MSGDVSGLGTVEPTSTYNSAEVVTVQATGNKEGNLIGDMSWLQALMTTMKETDIIQNAQMSREMDKDSIARNALALQKLIDGADGDYERILARVEGHPELKAFADNLAQKYDEYKSILDQLQDAKDGVQKARDQRDDPWGFGIGNLVGLFSISGKKSDVSAAESKETASKTEMSQEIQKATQDLREASQNSNTSKISELSDRNNRNSGTVAAFSNLMGV